MINEPRFSGTLILVKKKTWSKIGGFKEEGFLEVDDDFRKRLSDNKIKFAIMDGVYVYHWYRADNPYKTSSPMLVPFLASCSAADSLTIASKLSLDFSSDSISGSGSPLAIEISSNRYAEKRHTITVCLFSMFEICIQSF